MFIFHITTKDAWLQAQKAGSYSAPSLEKDGFIHFSYLHQVLKVANSFYRGQADLVLLAVEISRLDAELRVEAPVHPADSNQPPEDQLFPHLYGALNLDAVKAVVAFPPEPGGDFKLPPQVQKEFGDDLRL